MTTLAEKEVIAKRLKSVRGDIPRSRVAKSLGITVSALQNYEAGKRMPRIEIMIQLANYYHRTFEELFFE